MENLKEHVEASISDPQVEDGTFSDFMEGIENQIGRMIKESATMPKDAWEQWEAFSTAINWKEPFIRCLLCFHVVLFVFMLLTRKNVEIQCLLFFFILLLVMCSEYLNTYCSQHWRRFSGQNYFDIHGVFAGTLYSGPLLFIGFIQLVRTR